MPPDEPTGFGPAPSERADEAAWVAAWLAAARRAWRWEGAGFAACCAAVAILLAWAAGAAGIGIVLAALLAIVLAVVGLPGLRDRRVLIAATERHAPDLHNALRAWSELTPDTSPRIRRHLAAQVHSALAPVRGPRLTTWRHWAAIAGLAGLGAGLVAIPAARSGRLASSAPRATADASPAATALTWTITATPPAYAGRPVRRLENPPQVDVLAGTILDLDVRNLPDTAAVRIGTAEVPTTRSKGIGRARIVARQSDMVLVQGTDGEVLTSVALVVQPDGAPRVRITAPAADLRRDDSTGTVPVRVTAADDLGLRDLRLRFTKVSGSGESFTFEDGEWPLVVTRPAGTSWTGAYTIDLAGLALGPGDSVVYHAVAHDARPGPEGAAESERFLIEITRPGAQAAGDFSLPEPEEKFALSQRMVIQLTERLLEKRPRLRAEDYREQAQALAVAQRSVRAEFVFMLGGEVEDEFEEAAHSHEIEAGRLDNRGQSDLTEAVRHMSQAERRLTDVDLREALPYEYQALAALQAAFGKARYFMRTLPTPIQVDETRRLTGTLEGVTAAAWTFAPLPETTRTQGLQVLARLEGGTGDVPAAVLAAVVALDERRGGWVPQVQQAHRRDGRAGVARLLRERLTTAGPAWFPLPLARSADEALAARPR